MDSRTTLEGKLHFFEHYSVQKLEEYFRNALYYSLEIITTRDPRFVDLRYYIKEISLGLQLLLHGTFLLWKNASSSEFFYSYTRNQISKFRKLLSIIGMVLLPYAQTKLKEKESQAIGRYKILIRILDAIFNVWDFWLKSTYLLGGPSYEYFSPYFQIFGIKLERINEQRSKWEMIFQYGTLGLFLGLKFLDYYFSKKEVNFQQQDVVTAPQIQQKQSICAICKKQINNPAFLQTSGMVYCYKCIFQWVQENGQCPITKQKVDPKLILKIY